MPGNNPPSAMPKRARTAIKLPGPVTNPRHMVMIPHRAVRHGRRILGETFFRSRLLGSSLHLVRYRCQDASQDFDVPGDVGRIKDSQSGCVLFIGQVKTVF